LVLAWLLAGVMGLALVMAWLLALVMALVMA
jgi:hypothetical protein